MLTERDLIRASPAFLARRVRGPRWCPARHHAVLAEALVDLAYHREDRLLVSMPPQQGKSSILAEAFPAWFLGRFEGEIIYVSYEGKLAASWGAKARNVLEEYGPAFFGVYVAQDSRNSAWWTVRDARTGRIRGSMKTAGIDGSIGGKSADLVIVDDPYKGPKQANSRSWRRQVEEVYDQVAVVRLSPKGSMVLCHTRWLEDDLIGVRLREHANGVERWMELRFPAIAEAEGRGPREWRQPGEPLWPERYSLAFLERVRRVLPSYAWLSLYQQRPSSLMGSVFRRADFRYADVVLSGGQLVLVLDGSVDGKPERRFALKECRLFATMDLAFGESAESDYTVAEVFAWTPDADLVLLDVERTRDDPTLAIATIKALFGRWPLTDCGVEDVQYQRIVLNQGLKLGLPMRSLKAHGDKFTRSIPAQMLYRAHRVFHRRGAPWLTEFEDELLAFVRGKDAEHDDQVDCLAYAALVLQAEGPRVWSFGPPGEGPTAEQETETEARALADLMARLGVQTPS